MTRRYTLLSTLLPLLLLMSAAPRLHAQDLNVYMTASSEVLGPGDRTTYTLMVSNIGANALNGVSVQIQLPDHNNGFSVVPGLNCGNSFCSANEAVVWNVGTLAPGQSRSIFYRLQITENAPAETITSSATASAMGVSDASDALDIEIDPTPLLRLSLAPGSGPAVADEPFTYTLTVGNVGNSTPTDVTLTMPVPEGTTFEDATDGGSESGGTVTWNVGELGVGASRQFQMTVTPDESLADGAVLEAVAEIDPNLAAEPVARSSAVTPVRGGVPLKVEYAVSQTATDPDGVLTFTLTATNTGSFPLDDVSARVLLPDFIDGFSVIPEFNCGNSYCSANEAVVWNAGTLALGQSRTAFFRTRVAGDAPSGEVLRSVLVAEASNDEPGQVLAAQDLQVDPTPLLRLSLAPGSGPAVAGEPFTYTLTVSNVVNETLLGVTLTMPVPEGTMFESATDGGVLQNGVVTWDIGSILDADEGGQAELTVIPDDDLADGTILKARAELDPGNADEVTVRSSAVTPVRGGVPLKVEYAVSDTSALPGDSLIYMLTAMNTGTFELAEVEARVLLPDFIDGFSVIPEFNCGNSYCSPNEAVVWDAGTLAPGQSRTVFLRTTVDNSAPTADILRSLIVATAGGSNEAMIQRDALVGDDVPLPVELAAFTAALDGESVLLQWQTASETGNAGFAIEHRRAGEGTASEGTWQELAFLASKAPGGTSTEALGYAHRAEGLAYGRHLFRLKQVDIDGTESLSAERAVEITLAEAFALSAPAPNPFRQRATFTLAVKEAQEVQARVYDVLGRRVAVLHEGPMAAGQAYRLQLEAGSLASGLYLVRITGERFAPQTRRVVLMR